jgi:hypothetical protein
MNIGSMVDMGFYTICYKIYMLLSCWKELYNPKDSSDIVNEIKGVWNLEDTKVIINTCPYFNFGYISFYYKN